jgi:hypothetical protein
MEYCGEDINNVQVHPIAHVQDSNLKLEGPMKEVFAHKLQSMQALKSEHLVRMCDRFMEANKDTVSEDMKMKHEYAGMLMNTRHDDLANVAAYISCVEESQGLPSTQEIDLSPIIDRLHLTTHFNDFKQLFTNQKTLDCDQLFDTSFTGYFAVGIFNRSRVLEQVITHGFTASFSLTLEELDARYLRVSSDTMTHLMRSISCMKQLRVLNISVNPLRDVNTTCLSQCQALRSLDVSDMRPSDTNEDRGLHGSDVTEGRQNDEQKMSALILAIRELPQLTTLDLHRNSLLSGSVCFQSLCSTLGNLSNLTDLDLRGITFTKEQLDRLVDSCRGKQMQELW